MLWPCQGLGSFVFPSLISPISLKWVIDKDSGKPTVTTEDEDYWEGIGGRYRKSFYGKAATVRLTSVVRNWTVAAASMLLLLSFNSFVMGAPILQLYLEGGTYDSLTDTWYLAPEDSSAGDPFRLWVIGNTSWKGTIHGVRLSMAYAAEYRTADKDLQVTLTPAQTGGLYGFTDDSLPTDPDFIQHGAAGTVPILGDGTPLPTHGIFGPNTVWQEWLLGDFDLKDSPIADFVGSVPPPSSTCGQINVYEVSITFTDGTSAHGVKVHFDAYNHVKGDNHAWYRFAPFSHDADGDVTVIPEPGSVVALTGLLAGSGLPWGVSFLRRRRTGTR